MSTVNTEFLQTITLHDDLVIKISSLLLEDMGSTRTVKVELASFPLDTDLIARNVSASIRLTRLDSGVLAQGSLDGVVDLECVRCLGQFEQPFQTRFTEQYRQTVDILDGRGAGPGPDDVEDDDDDSELAFEINDAHEIDLTELLRQWIVLALPMTPVCGPDCPGPLEIQNSDEDVEDERFAALKQLLETGDQ